MAAYLTTEADLLSTVIEMAHAYGWLVHHIYDSRVNPRARRRSGRERYIDPGFPDLVLCRPPRLLFVELKRQDGRLRPEQIDWLDALEDCGVEAYIWRPRDIDRVMEILAPARPGRVARVGAGARGGGDMR